MAAVSTLRMTFNLDNGKTKTYTLAEPKSDLDAEQVGTVMGSMVAKNAVLSGGAMLESSKSAIIRTVEENVLF